jgi:hypothetical protein
VSLADYRGDDPDELGQALVDKFAARHIHHLADILDGDAQPLAEYYGEESADFGNKERVAKQLCPRHEAAVAQLLTVRDNHFRRRKINRTAVVEYLASEGVSVDAMEEMKVKDLLFAAFQAFYDEGVGKIPDADVKRLVARGTLFENRRDRAYFYENREFPFDEVDTRIDSFRRRYNRRNRKPLDIQVYEDEEEERVVLHLFQEKARQAQYVFSKRTGEGEVSGPPSVTTVSSYPVKAIRLRLQNREGVAELRLSKSAENNGWTGVLEDLLEKAFGVSNALDDAHKHHSEKVDEIVSSAMEVASDGGEDDADEAEASQDVEEVISAQIDDAVEEAVEAREEADDEHGFDSEELRERAENIEPVGFRIRDGDVIEEFELTAQTTLEDALDSEPGARDILESQLADAESEVTVGIKCRATLPDGRVETFVLEDGMPRPARSGLSREMQHVLNAVFDDDTTDN